MKTYQAVLFSGVAVFCCIFSARFLTSDPDEGLPALFVAGNYYYVEKSDSVGVPITTFSDESSCESIHAKSRIPGACVIGQDLAKPGDRRYYAYSVRGVRVDRVAGAFEDRDHCQRVAMAAAAPGFYRCGRLS
jgi:hypothetical protein